MNSTVISCPFKVGESVVFSPSERTRGLYQNIDAFGVTPGGRVVITEIREGTYLYFAGGAGGWSWNEFRRPGDLQQAGARAIESQKSCSICGVSFPLLQFSYGNRANRSYCQACSRAEKAAYTKGGRAAARSFREAMRGKWKP